MFAWSSLSRTSHLSFAGITILCDSFACARIQSSICVVALLISEKSAYWFTIRSSKLGGSRNRTKGLPAGVSRSSAGSVCASRSSISAVKTSACSLRRSLRSRAGSILCALT
jgi:hypothetical protein